MARMIQCAKLGGEAEGLDAPPFPGPKGQKIYETPNGYGLNLI